MITGVGRAGTTFLVRILTRLGFDTGFAPNSMEVDPISRAGLEIDLRSSRCAPYIVKSPWYCAFIKEILNRPDLVIGAAIVPMRPLFDSAQSRRIVQEKNGTSAVVPGRLWLVDDSWNQENMLATLFFNLIFHLGRKDIPMVFLDFSRLIRDPEYVHERLSKALQMPALDIFREAFWAEARVAAPPAP
jgi:hypothetical protein